MQRLFIHFSLIVLFAFTQIGMTAHQISHYADHQEQHHQDPSSHEDQCGQCITYNHLADADIAHTFWLDSTQTKPVFSSVASASHYASTLSYYAARAPPTILQT